MSIEKAEALLRYHYGILDENLTLKEHREKYPNHPWNIWSLKTRKDDNDYVADLFMCSKTWKNIQGEHHRIGAPALVYYGLFDGFEYSEQWLFSNLRHRVDGPALRFKNENQWYLFGMQLYAKEHQEIVDIYNELGDWLLAFSLSSFTNYNDENLKTIISKSLMSVG